MIKLISTGFWFLFLYTHLFGQVLIDYPEVGKICPEFYLNEVYQYKSGSVHLKDFEDKPLIVDFFSQYCTYCFESMPEVNRLRKEYKGKVEFLLIGDDVNMYPGKKRNIREDYFSFQKHFNLDIPVAFDSALVTRFKVLQFPYVIWIDDTGIVRAITSSYEVNTERIQKLINHQPLNLPLAKNAEQLGNDNFYNPNKRLLISGNGGDDSTYIYRSLLMKWDPRQGFNYDFNLNSDNRGNIQGTGLTVFALYRLAYTDTPVFYMPLSKSDTRPNDYGSWYLKPVLEITDSLFFVYDFTTAKNVFSYNLTVPGERSLLEIQRKMQSDLYNYFGFDVRVEKREMPYWKVIANGKARQKLPTKGGKPTIDGGHSGFTYVNQPVGELISKLWSYDEDEVYIDETGILSNIDIEVNAVLTDFDDFRDALRKQGLELVRGRKEMKTIVFYGLIKK